MEFAIAELGIVQIERESRASQSEIGNRQSEITEAREAQKAEHSIGNREVASSIPAAGSLKVDGGLATDDRRRSSVIVSAR